MSKALSLGTTFDNDGVTFSVFSEHANRMELCLFDPSGKIETQKFDMVKDENHIWVAHIQNIDAGQLYGFRAHGPNDPQQGHIFNAENILVDPYAKELHQHVDKSGKVIVLGCITDDSYDWEDDAPPKTQWQDTIFYELHPKGFSQTNEAISPVKRGTFSGLSAPTSIKHLKSLGITAVELMPSQAFLDEKHLTKKGRSNYWGYNTLSFFAPHANYLATGSADELKDTIKALHKAGIEVIMDVVYNHTAEGNKDGPTLSFKGLDNKSYYRLTDAPESAYVNDSGCGNTTNITHPAFTNLTLDSLRYWVEEFHIDGFRFDLALTLARTPDHFSTDSPFLQGIKEDSVLSQVKLIAEPWDCSGYELGQFPAPWAEWNDKYRDDVRKYWRNDPGSANGLAQRITGSSDIFEHTADGERGPQSSVNIIAVHDGFTLHDTVSYNEKHNEANGEGNRDGHNHNLSSNLGVEGPTDNLEINAYRQQQKRNMLATLFLSQGTPLLLAGDEFGNSQDGNNNTYCQDNETGWLNWDQINDEDSALQDFVAKMISFRKDHPALTHAGWLHGYKTDDHGVKDISWYHAQGFRGTEHWDDPYDHCVGVVFNNAALPPEQNPQQKKERLLIVFNSSGCSVDFKLPHLKGGSHWTHKVDTANQPNFFTQSDHEMDEFHPIPPRSLQVFTC